MEFDQSPRYHLSLPFSRPPKQTDNLVNLAGMHQMQWVWLSMGKLIPQNAAGPSATKGFAGHCAPTPGTASGDRHARGIIADSTAHISIVRMLSQHWPALCTSASISTFATSRGAKRQACFRIITNIFVAHPVPDLGHVRIAREAGKF